MRHDTLRSRRLILSFTAALALTATSIVTAMACEKGHQNHAAAAGVDPVHTAAMSAMPEAAPVKAGDLEITGYWTRAMLNGQPAGGGFMKITNNGKDADKLIAGSSPSAPRVEIHMMEVVDGVMNMRPVEGGLEIPAGGSVELKPGSFHVMFMGVPAPFQEGATVNLTLEFEKAGKAELVLPVMPANAKQMMHGG